MKYALFALVIYFSIVAVACKKTDDYSKPGVSLPAVSNLALTPMDSNRVKLAWTNPTDIPAEIQQPLSVYVEVIEIVSQLRTLQVFTITLPDAPTEYVYQLPDASKKYHLTVKMNGLTTQTDPNYSTNIFSLGQTVTYN